MKKVITIDCDNVLADTAGSFVQWYMQHTGKPLSTDDLDGQYLAQCTKLQHFVEQVGDPYLPFWRDVVNPETQTEIVPVDGSVIALRKLIHLGYSCVLVTGRGELEYDETYRWIRQRFPGVFDEIVFGYEGTEKYVDKGTLCKKVGSLLHIDDFIQNCETIVQVGVSSLLFDRAWNQKKHGREDNALIHRVQGWEDAIGWIDENLGNSKSFFYTADRGGDVTFAQDSSQQ